jgi:hypothetical protein
MCRLNSRIYALGLACAGWLLAGAPAFAQSTGSSFGGGGGSSGGGLSFGSSSGSSFGGSSFGGSSSGSSFGSSGFGGGSTSGNSAFGTNTTRPGSTSNTSSVPGRSGSSANVGATSFMGAYYGNPLAGGLNINQTSIGAPLYNLTGTAQTSTTSRNATNKAPGYYGAPLGLRRLPAYAVTLRIKDMPPPQTPLEVRADLQNMLAQSGQLDSRDAVRVLMDGQGVVLQGEVADEDERRLVENMVLLTPGVKTIRNELAARNPTP